MDSITFGGFVWPLNPEFYHQKFVREPQYVTSNGNTLFAGMSDLKRTISGSGHFTGANAYTELKNLAALCDGTPRTLVHPNFGEVNAYLTCVEMTQEPREDYVAYSFVFREANEDDVIPK